MKFEFLHFWLQISLAGKKKKKRGSKGGFQCVLLCTKSDQPQGLFPPSISKCFGYKICIIDWRLHSTIPLDMLPLFQGDLFFLVFQAKKKNPKYIHQFLGFSTFSPFSQKVLYSLPPTLPSVTVHETLQRASLPFPLQASSECLSTLRLHPTTELPLLCDHKADCSTWGRNTCIWQLCFKAWKRLQDTHLESGHLPALDCLLLQPPIITEASITNQSLEIGTASLFSDLLPDMHGALKKQPPIFFNYLGSHITYDKTAITIEATKPTTQKLLQGWGVFDTTGTPTQATQGNPSPIHGLQHSSWGAI